MMFIHEGAMTYAELGKLIQQLNPEQLAQNVTIFCKESQEFLPVELAAEVSEVWSDQLDEGHPYLMIRF